MVKVKTGQREKRQQSLKRFIIVEPQPEDVFTKFRQPKNIMFHTQSILDHKFTFKEEKDKLRFALKKAEATKDYSQLAEMNEDLSKELIFRERREEQQLIKRELEKEAVGEFKVLKEELNYDIAYNAHRNTSWTPDKRAEQEQKSFVESMNYMYRRLQPFATKPEQKKLLNEEMMRHKENYLKKYEVLLHRRGTIASSAVVGPSKFPTARMQKINDVDRRETEKFQNWNGRVFTSIRKKLIQLQPESERKAEILSQIQVDTIRDIKQASLTEIEGERVPLFVRNNAKGRITGRIQTLINNGQVEDIKQLLAVIEKTQEEQGKAVFTKRHKIWKSAERAKIVKNRAVKSGSQIIKTFEGGRIENNFDDERIQIFFDEKPSEEIRKDLKASGWRWSPKVGVWQRKNTESAKYSSENIISKHYQEKE